MNQTKEPQVKISMQLWEALERKYYDGDPDPALEDLIQQLVTDKARRMADRRIYQAYRSIYGNE